MVYEYIIPLLILGALAAAAFIVIRAVFASPTDVKMEIVLDTDEDYSIDVERAVVTTRFLSEKYFKNAEIYLRGKDEEFIQYLCKTYGVLHKE